MQKMEAEHNKKVEQRKQIIQGMMAQREGHMYFDPQQPIPIDSRENINKRYTFTGGVAGSRA